MGFFSKCVTYFDNEVENEYQLFRDCKVKQYQEEIVKTQFSNQEEITKETIDKQNQIENPTIQCCLKDENKKFDHQAFLENYRTCVFYKKLYSISALAMLFIAVLYSIVKLINIFV